MPLYNIHKTVKTGGKFHYPSDQPIELSGLSESSAKGLIERGFISKSGVVQHDVKTSASAPSTPVVPPVTPPPAPSTPAPSGKDEKGKDKK